MKGQKEATPVIFGERLIRIIPLQVIPPHTGCFGPHWHERVEVIRVLEGKITFTVGETTVTLLPGTLGIISPFQVHYGVSGKEPVSFEVVSFDIQKLYSSNQVTQKYLEPLLQQKKVFYPVTDEPEILRAYDNLISADKKDDHFLQIFGAIYTLLGALHRHGIAYERVYSKSDEPMNEVIQYINAHFLEKETTQTLSDRFGYNVSYFCRRFKKATGLPAMKYIQILRLEYAQRLLETTSESISAIAARCSFMGLAHFTHSFTEHFGQSPSAYRRNMQKSFDVTNDMH